MGGGAIRLVAGAVVLMLGFSAWWSGSANSGAVRECLGAGNCAQPGGAMLEYVDGRDLAIWGGGLMAIGVALLVSGWKARHERKP